MVWRLDTTRMQYNGRTVSFVGAYLLPAQGLAFATCDGDEVVSGRLKEQLTSIQLEMLSLTT